MLERQNTVDFDRNVNKNKNTQYYVFIFSKSELQSVNLKYITIRKRLVILYVCRFVML